MVVQHSEYTKSYQIVNGEIYVMGTISQKKKKNWLLPYHDVVSLSQLDLC